MSRFNKQSIYVYIIFSFLFISSALAEMEISVPNFSVKRGFYHKKFGLVLTTHEPNSQIKYTLDGSDPRFSASAKSGQNLIMLTIDPEDTTDRFIAPGVVVRAVTSVDDSLFSEVATHTYLFVNKAAELSPDGVRPGNDWPEQNTTQSSRQMMDYGLDPDVLNDPRYHGQIEEALLSIPSISIATDLANLFDSKTGIYNHADKHGEQWERPTSVELLNPDGSEGFQVNAGLRIRGGYSRQNSCPKHAFRLFFRQEYGAAKLDYPLFGEEGVDQFDKIDLRTSQNYSWSFNSSQGVFNTMNRDVFSRDLQRDMGKPYTRSRYYHLYINGVYWGLFQSQERPEARFAASYYGGSKEDYDVVKVDAGYQRPYTLEATDGTLDAFERVWEMCVEGFKSNDNYLKIQGLNPDGSVDPDGEQLINIENLIDYMLIIFYTANIDAPVSKFLSNKSPNNFYAIYNCNRKDGFMFFAHDCEHTLFSVPVYPGEGIHENRVNIGNLADNSIRMIVNNFSKFGPQWLHHRLTENEEYRQRFTDRTYQHLFNNGAMTPQNCINRFMERAAEIQMAIVAESARWGDAKMAKPRTKDDDWLPAIDSIIDYFFPVRTEIVINQLKQAGLYQDLKPPVFIKNDTEISETGLVVDAGYQFEIINADQIGRIIYTIDGTDPRAIGGAVSETAFESTDSAKITIQTTSLVKARILDGEKWSALQEIVFSVSANLSNLKITEIHYHPLDSEDADGREYEFLELKNIGASQLNLTRASFCDGIQYIFPVPMYIEPGEHIVLASNKAEFKNRYGMAPFDEYLGQLNNGGEQITLLSAAGDTIFSVRYGDKAPWPKEADSLGYSIVTREPNPTGDLNQASNWRNSHAVHGSPGMDDINSTAVHENETQPGQFTLFQNYPNPFNSTTTIRFSLCHDSNVTVKIFDILGQEVETLLDQRLASGAHNIRWDASKVAGGVYFCRLQSNENMRINKILYLK